MKSSGLPDPSSPHVQDNKILITGGAGSLGAVLARQLLFEHNARTVRVLDNDEYGLSKLKRTLHSDRLRLLLGDIRDVDRTRMAVEGADIVFHCAAVKNLEVSEYNPIEACKTNVTGTANVVEATLAARKPPRKFIFVSSDKAVHHSTLYGATKFVGEKIVLWAQRIQDRTLFSVARPGNFLTSRGNVFEVWDEQLKEGVPLSITHPDMQRYFISTKAAALFLVEIAQRMRGGEIFIPKMKEEKILDLALAKKLKHYTYLYPPRRKATGTALHSGRAGSSQRGGRNPSNPKLTQRCTIPGKYRQNVLAGIYRPSRLKVLQNCLIIQGVVRKVEHEKDGDYHVLVFPDQPYQHYLVAKQTNMVVEVVPSDQAKVNIPKHGDHVSVKGAWVYDIHHGWNEIHPAWSIVVH